MDKTDVGYWKKDEWIFFNWYQKVRKGIITKIGRKYLYVRFYDGNKYRNTKFRPDDMWRFIEKYN